MTDSRFRGTKGVPGIDGKQGPMGLPSDKVITDYRNTNLVARHIRSGGSRSIYPENSLVIIDTTESCTIYLPEIVYKETLCEDSHYYPLIIELVITKGSHTVVSETNLINEYFKKVELADRKSYKLISCGNEWILLL